MTNAEKFLKDGVDIKEIANGINEAVLDSYVDEDLVDSIYHWFETKAKPTLTVDERIILRNIKKDYTIVARDKAGNLFIATERDENGVRGHNALEFNRCLFQFIKNGEEYPIEELLKGE